jgi:hypothetical protein
MMTVKVRVDTGSRKRERSGPRRDRSFRPFESTYVAVRVTVVLAAFGLKMNTEPPTGIVWVTS